MPIRVLSWDRIPPEGREEARRMVEAGRAIRASADDTDAGRCGALNEVDNGRGNATCRKVAGWGTKHKGWGRCKHHEGREEGLAPWYGVVPNEVLRTYYAQNGQDSETGFFKETHGSTELREKGIRGIFGRYLDPEELEILDIAVASPVELLGVVMGVRTAGLLRIQRYLQAARVRSGGVTTADMVGAEGTADRTAATIARLAEARIKHLELEAAQGTHESIRELLRSLPDEDFAAMKRDPRAVALLVSSVGGADLLH